VLHACNKVKKIMEQDPVLKRKVQAIQEELEP